MNNGYWKGKQRDSNTLKRLSESKYKKVVQYDKDGNLIKIWDSCKDAAIAIFKDYQIINGSSSSKIYDVLECKTIKNRFAHNSYWFREKETIGLGFKNPPNKIVIDVLYELEKSKKKIRRKPYNHPTAKRYTVIHYNPDGTVKTTYTNTEEAAKELNISMHYVQRYCRGFYKNEKYLLKYGEKIPQEIKIKNPH